jgi:hypothetical protein
MDEWSLDSSVTIDYHAIKGPDLKKLKSKFTTTVKKLTTQERIAEARVKKTSRLMVDAQKGFLLNRLENSKVSMPMKHVRNGDDVSLRLELDGGWDPDQRDLITGRTLMHEAIAYEHLHIVKMLLIRYKVNPNAPTYMGQTTALHMAVDAGLRQIVSLLITHGAVIDAQDKFGITPLHLIKKLTIAKLVYRNSFNPCKRTIEGLRPSEYYAKYVSMDPEIYQEEIRRFLEEKEHHYDLEEAKQESGAQQANISTVLAVQLGR